ncbi:MAG: oligosaccharyl transferase, archaeosortase A system-associated [Methanoregula sp.]|nr:oligosaccharyl transferase, archaeosortase A system-associated [Methanoregula sp.]
MDLPGLKKHQSYIVIAVLLFFIGLALVLRLIPALFIHDPGFLLIFDTDSWYTMRQIEVMVKDFPVYNWFDPMTAYPTGKVIDWGPLYPGIAAIVCLITGATTRTGIIFASGWVSPLIAVIMVPLMFQLGKTVWNWKAGIISAAMISVVSIQYFSVSSYGWADHHIAEVLFSTLFFLSYIFTLKHMERHPVDFKMGNTLHFPLFLSSITGVIFFLALLSSTTVVLSLLVIALYTLIQNIQNNFINRDSDNLFLVNIVMLSIVSILFFLFGFKREGISLTGYSIGIVYVHFALIAETVVLFILSSVFRGKKILYLTGLAALFAGAIILDQINGQFHMLTQQVLTLFSGTSVYSVGVVETLPWTLSGAWENFNFALILMAGGLIILGYHVVKTRHNENIFILVWSVIMLLLTIQYQRFQYYFTVNLVLLAAICIAEPFEWRKDKIINYICGIFFKVSKFPVSNAGTDSDNPIKNFPSAKRDARKTSKRSLKSKTNHISSAKSIIVISVLLLTVGFFAISISQAISYGVNTPHHEISPDWIESLNWLKTNTPETGIDYFKSYDVHGFSYPDESYGILAVWDAGHWITFFAHRIPISNPFQDNLGGSSGTAAYFLSQNESEAEDILHSLNGKYVITNSDMAVDTFTNLIPWPSGSVDISPFIKWFMVPDTSNPSRLQKVHLYDAPYFQTMVARLHNFDGSMQTPKTSNYVQYIIRQVPSAGEISGDVKGYARVITNEQELDTSRIYNDTQIVKESKDLIPGRYANLFSHLPNQPVLSIPALKHYRLIHESPNNASVKVFPESDTITLPGIKYIKIFEYVRGAHIHGEGIIELPLVTNTGRTFVYRQESENGEFTVPYSTSGNPYEVQATGLYHIIGTSRYISVTEKDVTEANLVVG